MANFGGPIQAIENGFVGIEQAELHRQNSGVAHFRAQQPDAYERLVKASMRVKLAIQELESAKAAATSLPVGVGLGDLLDTVERDSRDRLKQSVEAATLQQLEQIGDATTVTAKPKKNAS